ncbi:MAG: hypothetical protein FWG03_04810, partial [Clostridiales bacterium]|nr:hypothetical protein [Clostridiales bacterium]
MNEGIMITGAFREEIGFAMQQNHVPVVRGLSLENRSGTEIRDITVTIATDPGIADEWSVEIDSVLPGREHVIDGIDLRLSASSLFGLTERIEGSLTVTASDASGILAREKRSLSFLSHNE